MRAGLVPSLTALGAVARALPTADGCNSSAVSAVSAASGAGGAGDVTIDAFQLYPENADFDKASGKAFFSVLYNASVAVYDPAENRVENIITFDRTLNAQFHASGVEVDPKTNQLSVIVNSGIAFDTQGATVEGDNFLYKVDLNGTEPKVLWQKELTAVTQGAYSGCQDAAHDSCGNTFVVCTYPGAIIKVSPDGKDAMAWYTSNYTARGEKPIRAGLTGIVAAGDFLIANDAQSNRLVRFNKRDKLGTPAEIALGGFSGTTGDDGVYMPEKYGGKVLLTQLSGNGTNVWVSRDGQWSSAEHVKLIDSKYTSKGGFAVAAVQMNDSIYGVIEYFLDAANKTAGTVAGPRSKFELEDLTAAIDGSVQGKI